MREFCDSTRILAGGVPDILHRMLQRLTAPLLTHIQMTKR